MSEIERIVELLQVSYNGAPGTAVADGESGRRHRRAGHPEADSERPLDLEIVQHVTAGLTK